MRTIKLTIAYDGTGFSGWQVQPGKLTVQKTLEDALEKLTQERKRIFASGRTDAGVHATGQVAHFRTDSNIPIANFVPAFNSLLPQEVVVKQAREMPEGFHARFSAKSKIYTYRILLSKVPDPFEERYSFRSDRELNIRAMSKELKSLKGRHDFSAFRASGSYVKSSERTILDCVLKKERNILEVKIEATGFLYNMMRNIIGTLFEIGRGHFSSGSMKKILLSRDRKKAGPTAPAKGLFLTEVKY